MNLIKRYLIADFVGRGWATLVGMAFVPLYIKFMGIEAFGFVGFLATLQLL